MTSSRKGIAGPKEDELEFPLYQVDAFTSQPFKGNPAAVCLLDQEPSDQWMQDVAAEMNLAETAFLLPESNGFHLRWFTPTVEMPLCGHATLASAHVLWETGSLPGDQEIRFRTLSGELRASQIATGIELDFPLVENSAVELPEAVRTALNVEPIYVGLTPAKTNRNYLLELESERELRELKPDFGLMRSSVHAGVIVTARSTSDGFDFVSRYFAPNFGVDEDPVTGSAHCALAPYWSRKLAKQEMTGYQASQRGGVVRVRVSEDRVFLTGEAVTVLRGVLVGNTG